MRHILPLLLTFLLFPLHVSAAPQTREVKIGFITDLSGQGAYWGKEASVGARLAEAELQKKGKQVRILIGDHQLSTKTSLTEAQKMISIDRADALFIEFAPTAVAASSLVMKSRKLLLNNSAATSILESNPYAFKAYLDYQKGCQEISQHWRSRGITNIGMLKLKSEFADLCLRGVKTVYPNLHVVEHDFGEDVTSHVLKLRGNSVQAIFNVGLQADLLNMFKAMNQLHLQLPVATCESEVTDKVRSKYSQLFEGLMTFGFPDLSQDFIEKLSQFRANESSALPEAAAMAYTHVHQMVRVIDSCERGDIDCQVAKMKAMPGDSTMSFVRWEDRIASYDFTLKEWKDGDLVLVKTFN